MSLITASTIVIHYRDIKVTINRDSDSCTMAQL